MSSGNHSKVKLMSMFVAMVVVITTTIDPVATIIVTDIMIMDTVTVIAIVPVIIIMDMVIDMIITTTKDTAQKLLFVDYGTQRLVEFS